MMRAADNCIISHHFSTELSFTVTFTAHTQAYSAKSLQREVFFFSVPKVYKKKKNNFITVSRAISIKYVV